MSDNSEKTESKSGWEGFQAEFLVCWKKLPNKGFFFGALAMWVALFHFLGNSTFGYVDTSSLFVWLDNSYSGGDETGSPGPLIPFVVLGLFWWKRDKIVNLKMSIWLPALGMVALALFLHLVGYVVQQTRLSVIGFFIGLYGMMGLFWGWPVMKASFFPFFLFAFCMPLGSMANIITIPLRELVAVLSSGTANVLLGIEVIREGTQIFAPDRSFEYDVAAACSGIRSLTAIFALTTVYAFMNLSAWWKRGLMIAIALPLAVLGNLTRITGVIIVAEAFGEDAGMKFHDWAGFFTFLLAFAGVLILGYFLEEKEPKPLNEPEPMPA